MSGCATSTACSRSREPGGCLAAVTWLAFAICCFDQVEGSHCCASSRMASASCVAAVGVGRVGVGWQAGHEAGRQLSSRASRALQQAHPPAGATHPRTHQRVQLRCDGGKGGVEVALRVLVVDLQSRGGDAMGRIGVSGDGCLVVGRACRQVGPAPRSSPWGPAPRSNARLDGGGVAALDEVLPRHGVQPCVAQRAAAGGAAGIRRRAGAAKGTVHRRHPV